QSKFNFAVSTRRSIMCKQGHTWHRSTAKQPLRARTHLTLPVCKCLIGNPLHPRGGSWAFAFSILHWNRACTSGVRTSANGVTVTAICGNLTALDHESGQLSVL